MIELTHEPIDCQKLLDRIADPSCGGQVMFVGTTRQWTRLPDGRECETDHLIYEAYQEMAVKQLEELAAEAKSRWPVKKLAITHRLGRVDPQEASVGVAVATPHRSEAFEAAKWLIDTLKHDVPIWKQEHYVQNGSEWIHPTSGSCRCDHSKPELDAARPPAANVSNPKTPTESTQPALQPEQID